MVLEIIAALIVALLVAVPGILLSFALLRKTDFGRFEKTGIGIVIGMLAAPTLAFLEFTLIGLKLSLLLVLVNYLVVLAAALALMWKQKQLASIPAAFKHAFKSRSWAGWAKENWAQIVLFVLVVTSFYVRIGSWNTDFFEFDPYYYTFMSEQIVRFGATPLVGEFAYYPGFEHEMRLHPLIAYDSASEYHIYSAVAGLSSFSKDALLLIQQIYPAIVGALLALFAYILVKEYYGKMAGLVSAAFFAFSPQLIKKFAAGVAELQPIGVFMALALFAVFAFAYNRKSKRVYALLAAFSFWAVLSGQQYLWPMVVLAAFIIIQAFLDYWNKTLDKDKIMLNAAVAVPAAVAFALLQLYGGKDILSMSFGLQLLLAGLVLSLVLWASDKIKLPVAEDKRRPAIVGAIAVIVLLALVITPLGSTVLGMFNSLTGFAGRSAPLANTIAEENPMSESFFAGSFGVLNPPVFLAATALVIAFYAATRLFIKGKKKIALAVVVIALFFVLFNGVLDSAVQGILGSADTSAYANLVNFITSSDVFIYLLVVLLSVVLLQLLDHERTQLLLLYSLIIFPVAYIGLNKMKYNLHLAIALAIAVGVLLGEAVRIIRLLNERYKFGSESSIKWTAVGIMLFVGGGLVAAQFFGIPGKTPSVSDSIKELQSSKISQDWLLAMSWLRNNTNMYDPAIQAQCNAKFGWDCSIMSWWDYGHWTNFLGETKSVLTPINEYADYNQEVAHGFVDGNTQDFIASMKAHHATHVLVDAE
ncbi:MAG: STT3 domain-containing protein, partial [Candidatus Micrarchaeia archaeon]